MTSPANGALAHFDLYGPDEDVLRSFYGQAFGWTVEPKGPGYALLEPTGSVARGAITERDRAGVTLGVAVDDLKAAITAVERHGGTVLMEPVDNGWVVKALVADPAGNELTLIQG